MKKAALIFIVEQNILRSLAFYIILKRRRNSKGKIDFLSRVRNAISLSSSLQLTTHSKSNLRAQKVARLKVNVKLIEFVQFLWNFFFNNEKCECLLW